MHLLTGSKKVGTMRELTLLYVHGENIGYARAGTMLSDQLRKRDVTVYDDDGYDNVLLHPTQNHFLRNTDIAPSPTNALCFVAVPSHLKGYWNGQHKSILTMWEAMHLPPPFRENLHEFDEIYVPSWHNVELFSKYHDNVSFIPLGVDPERWHYVEPTPPGAEFRFLISGRGQRKGMDLAYEAFRQVFHGAKPPIRGGPIPKLIMKSIRGVGDYFAPGIDHVTGKLTADEESDLYASSHCYLQPARGEGFGLQPLQAIAMGRPTILTNAHGHESFAHLGIPIGWKESKADYFIYGDAGNWWEPNLEELCEAMWDVYHNWEDHMVKAKASAQVVAESWTWENTADRFMDLLGPQMMLPYSGDGGRVESEPQLFKIMVNQPYDGEVAGRSLHFEPGKEYWDFADVKRIFFDAGILDYRCTEGEDHGLAPVQAEQRVTYKAHDEVCRTCGQILNSGIKKSDQLYEAMNND